MFVIEIDSLRRGCTSSRTRPASGSLHATTQG